MRPVTSPAEESKIILVVEDEEDLRNLARVILERHGFHILTAADGQEGIELFESHARRIELVLLDLTMPRLSGNEVLRRIRALTADVPVLLMSGFVAEDVDPFPRTGFLAKPFDPSQLLDEIK